MPLVGNCCQVASGICERSNQLVGKQVMGKKEYFRPNVGMVICNVQGQVLLAQRVRDHGWQFPQGGIGRCESPERAMYRELMEEVGLAQDCVCMLGTTRGWLRYRLPVTTLRNARGTFVGQKQKWFLLQLQDDAWTPQLELTPNPEFVDWRWVSYWYPVGQVVSFKRHVYRKALHQLSRYRPAGER